MRLILGKIIVGFAQKFQSLCNQTTLLLLKPRQLTQLSLWNYSKSQGRWISEANNKAGYISPNEEELINLILNEPRNESKVVLDLFCGGGREALPFIRKDWHVILVDGLTNHVNAASSLLKKEHPHAKLEVHRLILPEGLQRNNFRVHAALVLYAGYSMIADKSRRLLLNQILYKAVIPGGQILFSALINSNPLPFFRLRRTIATLLWGNTALQEGDRFFNEFTHHFRSLEEFESELTESGYSIVQSNLDGNTGISHILVRRAIDE